MVIAGIIYLVCGCIVWCKHAIFIHKDIKAGYIDFKGSFFDWTLAVVVSLDIIIFWPVIIFLDLIA